MKRNRRNRRKERERERERARERETEGERENSVRIAVVVAAAAGCNRKLRLSAERYCHEELFCPYDTTTDVPLRLGHDVSAAAKIPNENSRRDEHTCVIFGVALNYI